MAKRISREEGGEAGPRYNVRAVERALGILDAFSFQERELSLGQLAAKTQLSKPTVFRILSTLEHHSYVSSDPAQGVYRLGPRFLELGGIVLSSLGLQKVARPHLDQLQREIRVTILFGVLINGELVFIDKRESDGPIRIFSEVGFSRSPAYGMLGMTLMAFTDAEEAKRLLVRFPLEAYTRHSITDEAIFLERLRQVREQGYALEFNEAIEGVWGVAAPVWDARRKVVAAVGAALPISEQSDERVAEVVDRVRACSQRISGGMGYRPT